MKHCVILLLLLTAFPARAADYARDIKPILKRKCYACHSVLRQRGGLRLDAAKYILRGGDDGKILIPRDSKGSRIIERVLSREKDVRMPPEGDGEPLSKAELRLLREWIDQGALPPKSEVEPTDPRRHWSYRPPSRPSLPKNANLGGASNPVDLFVAAQRQKQGLRPSPRADKSTLLRRVYLDLVGVPPTPSERRAFLASHQPDAYEQVVRRLLADPRYGKRWGRHWMDIWRYSDWHGSGPEIRYSQRHLWRWRDWIVRSLNADHGYDRMLTEMLAADEVAPLDDATLPATGFIGRNWYKFDRNVWMRELVEHSARGFLAITLKCARCHDHKYDPIPQEDYYRFRAFFEPHNVRTDPLSNRPKTVADRGKRVLANGIARVFDAKPDAATYVFTRGDDRYPDKDRLVIPGVPGALGRLSHPPRRIKLPAAAIVPQLRHALLAKRLKAAELDIHKAQAAVAATKVKIAKAEKAPPKQQRAIFAELDKPVFADRFHKASSSWKIIGGKWKFKNKRLVQTGIGSFLAIRCQQTLPRDFLMRLRYVIRKPGDTHSVGFNFDAGTSSHQSVYTWINPKTKKSGVQAFHRENGADQYPRAGMFSCKLQFDKPIILDIAVRGQTMNVWVDGKLRIVYQMPKSRTGGKLDLWNHEANAEYSEIQIFQLPVELRLSASLKQSIPSPLDQPQRMTGKKLAEFYREQLRREQHNVTLAVARLASSKARIRAEQARLNGGGDFTKLAQAAARAEQRIAWLEASWSLENARRQLTKSPSSAKKVELQKAQQQFDRVTKSQKATSTRYKQFPITYPRESSGRRTALARWLTRADNPRTSRVAVNHIWLRLFGQAIVESVDDFGLRGKKPTHPQLLDWLAIYLVDRQWRMKPLHYLLVTSQTYQQSSATQHAGSNAKVDPNNRYLWRMHHRRMDAEVVRDSVLHVGGLLNEQAGGPEIVSSSGMINYRRSMYFWIAPNRQMQFLKLFDTANPDECYRRKPSVVPQQALAMSNSSLITNAGRKLARSIQQGLAAAKNNSEFIQQAFEHVLCRSASAKEIEVCKQFLKQHARLLKQPKLARFGGSVATTPPSTDPALRAKENLILVLLNHNDFLTIR